MFKEWLRLVWGICKRFVDEGGPSQAAGLAYITLLSLVPLMTVSLTVLSAFPIFKGLGENIQHLIFANFVTPAAQVVQQHLSSFMSQTAKLSATGLLSLVFSAVLMIFSIEAAFNQIWQVKKRRGFVQALLMYWAVLTLTPILIGTGIAASSYLISLKYISAAISVGGIKKGILMWAPYLATFLAFTWLYVAVPNCKVKIRFAAIGAFVATIMYEVLKYGFTYYVITFSSYRLIYGALASIPIFLVWLYFSWMVLLFGASISYEISEWRSHKECCES